MIISNIDELKDKANANKEILLKDYGIYIFPNNSINYFKTTPNSEDLIISFTNRGGKILSSLQVIFSEEGDKGWEICPGSKYIVLKDIVSDKYLWGYKEGDCCWSESVPPESKWSYEICKDNNTLCLSLRSYFGNYLTMNCFGQLQCSRTIIGEWEKFYPIHSDTKESKEDGTDTLVQIEIYENRLKQIGLMSKFKELEPSHDFNLWKNFKVDDGGENLIHLDGIWCNESEEFELIYITTNETILLKSVGTESYLCSDDSFLIFDTDYLDEKCRFKFEFYFKNILGEEGIFVALKSYYGRYITVEAIGSSILAYREVIGERELFKSKKNNKNK